MLFRVSLQRKLHIAYCNFDIRNISAPLLELLSCYSKLGVLITESSMGLLHQVFTLRETMVPLHLRNYNP